MVIWGFVRPEKWNGSQVGFRGSNAPGGRIVLLPGAFWARGASKMATLSASMVLYLLQCFRAEEGMLLPGACRMCFRQAHCFMQGPLRFLPVLPKSHMSPLPHLGFRPYFFQNNAPYALMNGPLSFKNGRWGPLSLGAYGVGTLRLENLRGFSSPKVRKCPPSRCWSVHRG